MNRELIPASFFRFPSRWRFFWDDDNDNLISSVSASSGLTVSEDDENVYVEAAVPGADPKDVEVTFDKGMLWIRGESKEEEKDKERKYYRRSARLFSYRVSVPGNVDMNADPIATCKNGVMKVTFAKTKEAQPKKIAVKQE